MKTCILSVASAFTALGVLVACSDVNQKTSAPGNAGASNGAAPSGMLPSASAGMSSAGSGGEASASGGSAGSHSAGGDGTATSAAGNGGAGGTLSGSAGSAGTANDAGSGGMALGGNGGSGGGVPMGPFLSPRGTKICDDMPLGLGEMHALTNEWTDPDADTCTFLNLDGTFGWKWTRGATGTGEHPTYPNYPEIEFGINPWNTKGIDVPTTSLLPLQLKDFKSASMTVDVSTQVSAKGGWNLAFELWLADSNPKLGPAKPKGEIMVFLSNDTNYWPTSPETDQHLNDGSHDFKLYVSSDNWGTWGYYRQYRLDTHDGHFNGKLDIYKFLEHYLKDEHWDGNLWVTRFEIGNEVYQDSGGTTTFNSLSFEVNGQTRSAKTQ